MPVPDDALLGAGDTFEFTSTIHGIVPNATWTGVRVNLDSPGGFNGDLYVYLEHGTDFAVLLNRPGRSTGLDSGYGDSGFNISLDDTAPNGDVHVYRARVNPGGGILTGRWQPDGRDVIPEDALDTHPRSALLSTFLTGNPNGEWSLTVVDVGPGDRRGSFNGGWSSSIPLRRRSSCTKGSGPPEPRSRVGRRLLSISG